MTLILCLAFTTNLGNRAIAEIPVSPAIMDYEYIDWGGSTDYTTGEFPTVATTKDGYVIEIHGGSRKNESLYYNIGRVSTDGKNIEWIVKGKQYDTGQTPSVAVTPDGKIIETHRGNETTKLYYNIGTVDAEGKSINWNEKGEKYDTGRQPSVAVTPDGKIIEVHRGRGSQSLYCTIGTVNTDGKNIDWVKEQGTYYTTGHNPSVTVTRIPRQINLTLLHQELK